MKIDELVLRDSLVKMPDGFAFEKFAHKILAIVFGDEFIPVGGSGDRGIDGFEHVYQRKKLFKLVYQISTEQVHWKQKINKISQTENKLNTNKIEHDKLHYVTNQEVTRKDTIQDEFYSQFDINLTIYDQDWFVTKILSDPRAADVYTSFLESHYHEFNKPGKLYEVGNFSGDTRLYVFLRQQVDEGGSEAVEDNVLDGLILYSLEDTGSEKEIFMNAQEIVKAIQNFTQLSLTDFDKKIAARLSYLCSKEVGKVKHHTKENNYCLPFETRVDIAQRNLKDITLQEDFKNESIEVIKRNLKIFDTKVKDIYPLLEEILHSIYYRQGLEFSDFILNHNDKDIIDQSLQTIVSRVVDDSNVLIENKGAAKTALLVSLREIAYNGSAKQCEFLRRLSKTYMMFFLTQNDPNIALFFQSLANKLEVYVGTSIIIPALSEFFLADENKRYWNLLAGARASGVSLKINEYIVDELVSHVRGVHSKYLGLYQKNEADYLEDEISFLYIDEILIRAYFYARLKGRVKDFNSYLMKFVNPNLSTAREDIIFYLKETFGIEYVTTSSQGVSLDEKEVQALIEHLKTKKQNSKNRAEVDARLILHLYKLREMNNETDSAGIFGYKTWWLSQDVNTFRSVKEVFGDKYSVSCYMRSDFMYKYISLSPKKEDIDILYKQCFPNLMGVNLSYHIPNGISEFVSQMIEEHKDTDPAVVRRILKNLTKKLMSSEDSLSAKEFKSYFEEELEAISKTH